MGKKRVRKKMNTPKVAKVIKGIEAGNRRVASFQKLDGVNPFRQHFLQGSASR